MPRTADTLENNKILAEFREWRNYSIARDALQYLKHVDGQRGWLEFEKSISHLYPTSDTIAILQSAHENNFEPLIVGWGAILKLRDPASMDLHRIRCESHANPYPDIGTMYMSPAWQGYLKVYCRTSTLSVRKGTEYITLDRNLNIYNHNAT